MIYLRFVVVILFFSCHSNSGDYALTILKEGAVDSSFVEQIDKPGRMLLGWYLYAYGNECIRPKQKPKCLILDLLSVDNECDTTYTNQLERWFENDVYRSLKLKKCPNLPVKGAIQNEFRYLALERKKDTLSISFRIDGMNNSQEKSWNVERVERFLVVDGAFMFLE